MALMNSYVLDRMMDYRAEQAEKLKNNPALTIGDVTTVNLTIIKGGLQSNVVPSSLSALFDCRLAIDVDHNAFEEMVSYKIIEFRLRFFSVDCSAFSTKPHLWNVLAS